MSPNIRIPTCQRMAFEGEAHPTKVTNEKVHRAGRGCHATTTLAVGDEPEVQMSLFLDHG